LILEIKFYGRGGQGVVMASHMLAEAFFRAGFYPQCFSVFVGERRGAPVEGFLRVSKERIRLRCGITNPDHLVLMSVDLFVPELFCSIKEGGLVLVNSKGLPYELLASKGNLKLAHVDAQGIADSVGLGRAINTAVLGAYCRLLPELDLEVLRQVVRESVPAKVEENLKALELAYQEVTLVE